MEPSVSGHMAFCKALWMFSPLHGLIKWHSLGTTEQIHSIHSIIETCHNSWPLPRMTYSLTESVTIQATNQGKIPALSPTLSRAAIQIRLEEKWELSFYCPWREIQLTHESCPSFQTNSTKCFPASPHSKLNSIKTALTIRHLLEHNQEQCKAGSYQLVNKRLEKLTRLSCETDKTTFQWRKLSHSWKPPADCRLGFTGKN